MCRIFPAGCERETGAASAAGTSATPNANARTETLGLSRLRRRVAEVRRRCIGDVGVRPGMLSGDSSCAPEAELQEVERIVQAAAPSRPIARGLAGPGLRAHVLISKYADHLPLYRQCEIYERQGVELERSTLADWVAGCSNLLDPLVEALRRYVMAAGKLHADDTRVPVLAPGTGKTKTGRLWTYVRDDRPAGDTAAPAVWFAYSPDRGGEHPQQHLRTFSGCAAGRCLRRFQSAI